MATCPACGADIQHAQTEDDEKVPLEVFTEPVGASRFRVVRTEPSDDGRTTIIVEPVKESAPIDAYPDHRLECPDYGNGLV